MDSDVDFASFLAAPLRDRRAVFDALNALSMLDAAGSDTTLSELALAWKRGWAASGGGDASGARPPPLALKELFERHSAHYREEQVATKRNLRRTMLALCRALGPALPVATMTERDVAAALVRFGNAKTHNGHVRNLATALRWAVREGLLPPDAPLAGWRFALKPEPFREPEFFPPLKVERIMRIAEAHPGSAEAAVGMRLAMGFFAGVRSAEMERARWEDLDLAGGAMRVPRPKGWTSGTRPRIVELERNAVLWLGKWKEWTTARLGGRELRGPVVVAPKLFAEWKKARLEPEGLSWGRERAQNVMRHTYATMHVAAFRDAAATALNLGHGKSVRTLERHYMGLASRAAGREYWRIVPT